MLGKIKNVRYGIYDGNRFGLVVELSFADGMACQHFTGTWIKMPNRFPGAHEVFNADRIEAQDFLIKLLQDAKVTLIEHLKDQPIMAELEGNMLKSWRILTEVK